MKRLHVSVAVDDLDSSISFYATLFGAAPTVRKPDYAKWMLDDPRVNFALAARGGRPGVDHLGIQVESADELKQVADRLAAAEQPLLDQLGAECCYARSDKAWSKDPQGVAWETFHTHDTIATYGRDIAAADAIPDAKPTADTEACCAQGL